MKLFLVSLVFILVWGNVTTLGSLIYLDSLPLPAKFSIKERDSRIGIESRHLTHKTKNNGKITLSDVISKVVDKRKDFEPSFRVLSDSSPATLLKCRGGATKPNSTSLPASVGTTNVLTQTSRYLTSPDLLKTFKTLFFIALWYALNVHYNLVNKRVLNHINLPYTIATLQLLIGAIYVGLLWTFRLRPVPSIFLQTSKKFNNDTNNINNNNDDSNNSKQSSSFNFSLEPKVISAIYPVGVFHGLGQICTVLSLGAGAVSFTHIVKAMEPFFSALVAMIYFHQIFSIQVYLTLIPVVFGVSLACYSDMSFNWLSFLTAMTSNAMFALRANYSKLALNELRNIEIISESEFESKSKPELMQIERKGGKKNGQGKGKGELNFTPQNIYALVTIASLLFTIPIALLMEGRSVNREWSSSLETSNLTAQQLCINLIASGLSHYLNNEVMYLALDNIHPISLAVANTFKRVVIIIASLIVYKTKLTPMGSFGSLIGVTGVLLYSLAKK